MKNDAIELAVLRLFCSTDYSRQTLWYPYGEGGSAYATDGRKGIRLDGIEVPERDRGDKPFPAKPMDGYVVLDGDGAELDIYRLDALSTIAFAAATDFWISRSYRGDDDDDPVDDLGTDIQRHAFVKIGGLVFAADLVADVAMALRLLGNRFCWAYLYEVVRERGMLRIWSRDRRLRIVLMAVRDGYGFGEGTVGERPRDVSCSYDSNGVLHLPEY